MIIPVLYGVGAVIVGLIFPLILIKTSNRHQDKGDYFLLAIMGATAGMMWPITLFLCLVALIIFLLARGLGID